MEENQKINLEFSNNLNNYFVVLTLLVLKD